MYCTVSYFLKAEKSKAQAALFSGKKQIFLKLTISFFVKKDHILIKVITFFGITPKIKIML